MSDHYTIWKYDIPDISPFTITMPRQAQILDIQFQSCRSEVLGEIVKVNSAVMWVLLDIGDRRVERQFVSLTTGYTMKAEDMNNRKYVKTVQKPNGLILHIFEEFVQ